MKIQLTLISAACSVALLNACSVFSGQPDSANQQDNQNNTAVSLYGTLEPFAQEAVYFALTDRFVDADKNNNYPEQGKDWGNGQWGTFDRLLAGPNGQSANVGYLGGDFKGVLNNAEYIANLGFTSVWLTPIWDNPEYAFNGGETITFDGGYKDGGKTGYHGYWAHNFYQPDEHLVSTDLSFRAFSAGLKQHNLKFVLDIVANHGSPAYSMPEAMPQYGKIYDATGNLLADHQNLHPTKLDKNNPLHQFYNTHTGLAQLSDIDENNPSAFEYLTDAYLYWIAQGVDAIRIDTIREMPHHFWYRVSKKIRQHYPDMFMFGESYNYDASFIAQHTYPQNGGVSVLDFPGRASITQTFENKNASYADIVSYLHLTDEVYANPYELMTFYDNHDMPRMNADDNGFIDANNWLFTSRGIPVIYYGSEINFMTGKAEHQGNRNYFGQQNIEIAKTHPIALQLKRIADVRKNSIALQRGLQLNIEFSQETAAFYRIYQHQGENQTALVLLNKSDYDQKVKLNKLQNLAIWRNAFDQQKVDLTKREDWLFELQPHSVQVYLLDKSLTNSNLVEKARKMQR
ncbi:alpha-amylase family glycosyl hydrolase [Catenovulum sediminis]|uniref:alpha-amylase family glycosyl hydrolase n=1 Tax=Catenovulum sediminis TaxID=1740262 RepID=UPI00117BE426|nr:alpha-amylase family glycosyl hydrolase [Catenovulum sediminis]